MTIDDALQQAAEHQRCGQLAEAAQVYHAILTRQPQNPVALHRFGLLAHLAGQSERAIELIERAIAARPEELEYYGSLAAIEISRRRFDEAAAALRRAVTIRPDFSDGFSSLGVALQNASRLDEAIEAFRRAVALQPNSAEAHFNLASAMGVARRWDESIQEFRAALELNPGLPGVRERLGNSLRSAGRPDEAVAVFRQVINDSGDTPELRCAIANALSSAGLLDEAQAEFRRAMQLRPDDPRILSISLFLLQYQPGVDSATILHEHLRWNEIHARPLRRNVRPPEPNRDVNRKLRIGYVSPDFREHVLAHFFVPVFTHHDRESFEITCYSDVGRPDSITRRIRGCVDHWHDTATLSDEQLAEQIRTERLDVLVDLTMHMTGSRLPVFARQPAPVQITWIAYPGTTGLSAMHYRLTDPYLDPPGAETGRYSEESIRLPDTFWCYDAMSDAPVSDPPVNRRGHVTFGCLNNFCKVNPQTLSQWARVLREVDRSRLILMAPLGSARQRVLDQLADDGIEAARIEFVDFQPRAEYLKTYHRIDICLDTIPYNGHTTSLDAMWMGVPVVTRVGKTVVGRAGWSQLSNLRLTELAGSSEEEFSRIAIELATDLPRLAELRRTLRQRMLSSPLTDAARFTRNLEAVYRNLWIRRCGVDSA